VLGISVGNSDDAIDETEFLEELANEAVLDILTRTRVHVRRGEAALAEGSSDFDVDDEILRIHGIHRGSEGLLLYEQPREELRTDGYAFAGLSRLTLGQPAGIGETVTFWYTPKPTPMTNDAHDPADQTYGRIPDEYHKAIVDYMLWHAADMSGDQEAGRGEKYRVLYESQDGTAGLGSDLGRIKAAVNARGGVTRIARRRTLLMSDECASFWVG